MFTHGFTLTLSSPLHMKMKPPSARPSLDYFLYIKLKKRIASFLHSVWLPKFHFNVSHMVHHHPSCQLLISLCSTQA